MAASKNELRAFNLLSERIMRSVAPWPGKKNLVKLMAACPDITDGGNLIANDATSDGMADYLRSWGSIWADGYFIEQASPSPFCDWNPLSHHLCLVEVETTSRMTESKLTRYARAWDDFLGTDAWEFHIIVWDWYDEWREVDMQHLYYRSLTPFSPDPDQYEIESARIYGEQFASCPWKPS